MFWGPNRLPFSFLPTGWQPTLKERPVATTLIGPHSYHSYMSLGESLHVDGADGVRRAKRWLELTGRAQVPWQRYSELHTSYLTFANASGEKFSFDLGGYLTGEPFNGVQFLAEVKNYEGAADQHPLYQEYLAKCYRVCRLGVGPREFMWITWHPFKIGEWRQLCGAEKVKSSVDLHRSTYLDDGEVIDEGLCGDLASRLWLIVLSEKQETLCLTPDMMAVIRADEERRAVR